jgi:A1 cistron-splicing factor AAR2
MEPQEMTQDTAKWLFDEGAMFVFLDVPAGTEFGIDCNSWQVGPKFKGVKMIPPGVHFIYYR